MAAPFRLPRLGYPEYAVLAEYAACAHRKALFDWRARLPALTFKPGDPRPIFGSARPEFRRVDAPNFRGVDLASKSHTDEKLPWRAGPGEDKYLSHLPALKNAPPSACINRVQTGVFFEKCFF